MDLIKLRVSRDPGTMQSSRSGRLQFGSTIPNSTRINKAASKHRVQIVILCCFPTSRSIDPPLDLESSDCSSHYTRSDDANTMDATYASSATISISRTDSYGSALEIANCEKLENSSML